MIIVWVYLYGYIDQLHWKVYYFFKAKLTSTISTVPVNSAQIKNSASEGNSQT